MKLRALPTIGAGWRSEVRDTGPDIAPELQAQVFEEFFQVGNEERDRTQGMGLGLSIVRRMAALLGHPLGLRCTPGRGCCLHVQVPRVKLGEPGPRQRLVDGAPDRALVLIVPDDDTPVRHSLATLLSRWGHRVLEGGDAAEAVQAWRHAGQPRIDAAVVDMRLRAGRTGAKANARLRASLGAELAALVVTGDIAPQRLAQLNDAGQTWLPKPLMPARLRSWLRALA